MKIRQRCDCCGSYTLVDSRQDAVWDIGPVCYWKNDVSGSSLDEYSDANHMTLKDGRENYRMFQACDQAMEIHVRAPIVEELPEHNTK